jgi:hypothetical protein
MENMNICEKELMSNYRTHGRYFKEDVIKYESSIILCWNFISQMVIEFGVNDEDMSKYQNICQLRRGKRFNVPTLLELSLFIYKYLHLLKLSNLFIPTGKNWQEEIEDEY